jgi:hypothetical protein
LLAVGAAFDFHSGRVRRAPRWMHSSGLEWLFRLMIEPRRLWRRYTVTNVIFAALLIQNALGSIVGKMRLSARRKNGVTKGEGPDASTRDPL